MLFIAKILFINLLTTQSFSVEGKYSFHEQVCSYVFFTNYNYTLELKETNNFSFTKSAFDSRTGKKKFELTAGTWLLQNDILLLSTSFTTNKISVRPEEVKFRIVQDKLIRVSDFSLLSFPGRLEKQPSVLKVDHSLK